MMQQILDLFKRNPEPPLIDVQSLIDDFRLEVEGTDHNITYGIGLNSELPTLLYNCYHPVGGLVRRSLSINEHETRESLQGKHNKVIEHFIDTITRRKLRNKKTDVRVVKP